jgi:hypothetical protein
MKHKFNVIIEFFFIEVVKGITGEHLCERSAASEWRMFLWDKINIVITGRSPNFTVKDARYCDMMVESRNNGIGRGGHGKHISTAV